VANVTKKPPFVQGGRRAGARPRALLVYPPIYDFALYDLFLKPFALLRLGAWLGRAGYDVRLVNALDYKDRRSIATLGQPKRERWGTGKFFRQVVDKPSLFAGIERSYARYGIVEQSLEERIASERADVVLVSAGMTYWYPGVVEAIRAVRKYHPRAPVLLGGIYPTLCPEHAREVSEADYLVSGPAAARLEEILGKLSLPAVTFNEDEEPVLLPEANWEAAAVRLNRGCPLACAYCSSRSIEPKFVPGNPDSLWRTVREAYSRYGTRSFAFYDDALLARKETALLPFLESLSGSNLPLSFYLPNAVHLRFLDFESALAMKRAGFREVRLGFESALRDFHINYDRKFEPSLLADKLEYLLQAGFQAQEVIAYVLAGLPRQGVEEVEQSIRYAASFGIRVQLAEYSPTPASALWQTALKYSCFPLAEDPLVHNNTIMPMRWKGFTLEDLQTCKDLARSLSSPSVHSPRLP